MYKVNETFRSESNLIYPTILKKQMFTNTTPNFLNFTPEKKLLKEDS